MSSIEQRASELLEHYNLKKAPISVKKLIKKMGISLERFDFGSEISGVLVIENGNPRIGYNPSESNVRQRFTMAHELGHFSLNHCSDKQNDLFVDNIQVLFRKQNSTNKEIKQEREANAFAAALLMPSDLIETEILKYELNHFSDDEIIKELASKFKVSQIAMSYRLMNLGYINYKMRGF